YAREHQRIGTQGLGKAPSRGSRSSGIVLQLSKLLHWSVQKLQVHDKGNQLPYGEAFRRHLERTDQPHQKNRKLQNKHYEGKQCDTRILRPRLRVAVIREPRTQVFLLLPPRAAH